MEKFNVEIKWLIHHDMPEVLNIEAACFSSPWTEDDFLRCLRQRNCIGMVAERNEKIWGFMIYELGKSQLHVLNFAVHPDARRRGVGMQMAEKLIGKLSQQRRPRITMEVRESNLPALAFWRAAGFRAVRILRNFYDDSPDDAVVMQHELQLTEAPPGKYLHRGIVVSSFPKDSQ